MSQSIELKNFSEVHKYLSSFIPQPNSERKAYTLERMSELMEFLGNPQDEYKVIHVAGTSGKTSTCYYIASLLKNAGLRIGLMVSPHVDELNERVQLNLKPLAEAKFCSEFTRFASLVNKSGISPTYFEMLCAFAFWEFRRQKVEYAVIEVGLGGLLDATNVINRRDKLCVITDIGLDHTEVLGKTVSAIASQKAGIIKPHNTVVMYDQDDDVNDVIREVSSQQQARLHEIWPLKTSELPNNLPLFQRRNWYLAYSVYEILKEKYDLRSQDEAQLKKSTDILIPARMEEFSYEGHMVIVDGAHNQQKLQTLIKSLKKKYPKEKYSVVLSFGVTKQSRIKQCLESLLPISDRLYITTFDTALSEKSSVDPLKIVEQCESLGFESWEVIEDPAEALNQAVKSDKTVLVTGSFYLLNHIRPILKSQV